MIWDTCILRKWENHFLGRLIRRLGVPKERGVWNSQGGRKDKLFFLSLHSLRLSNNNVSCLRTVSGLTLLANSVILKCKLWKKVWWGLYNLQTFFGFIGEYITSLLTLARGSDACVRSFLYLLYTLIKLYYTKALSNQASSLVSDWILLLRGPRILVSSRDSTTTFQKDAPTSLTKKPCPTLCDPLGCSPPGSSVRGILQARVLELVAISSSRGSSRPRDGTRLSYVSYISRQVLYH